MSTDGEQPSSPRAYDARRRRERAEEERRDTRARVLAAARTRFLSAGYAGTKMADIATEAGVAIASVYRAGHSKSDLIQALVAAAVTGHDPTEMPLDAENGRPALAAFDPPTFPQITAVPDPEDQVRIMADLICDALVRMGPLWSVLRDAAAVDEGAAEALRFAIDRRGGAFVIALEMLPQDRLRGGVDECIDTLWALSSPELYLMLLVSRGWTVDRYRDWLRRTLVLQLLTP